MTGDLTVESLGVAGFGKRPNRWGVFVGAERVATIKRIGNQFELVYRGVTYPAKFKLADAVDLFRRIQNGSY